MPSVLLIWGLLYFYFGAIMAANDGLGFDGVYYGKMTKYFYEQVLNGQLNFYRIQRIVPPFIMNTVLTILNLPKEIFFIVKGFQLYNLVLLILCAFLWNIIAQIYKLNLNLTWLGFILWFLNFGIAQISFYYPVLTDVTAFFLGFCLLYFHLKDNLTGKVIITILGAFTWASFIYYGILMILFPIKSRENFNINFKKLKINYLSFLLPLPFLFISIYYISNYFSTGIPFPIIKKEVPSLPSFFYLSSVINYFLMVYFFSIYIPSISFLKYFLFFKKVLLNIKIKNIVICFLIFTISYCIQKYFSSELASGAKSSFAKMLYSASLYSCYKPFVYIIVAITYFGPSFILLFFYLKCFKPFVQELGIGVYLSFIISFIMLFTTEARLIIIFFPFLVLLTILILKEINFKRNFFIWISIFSLILSKIYIPLYGIPIGTLSLYEFPNQLLFMNTFTISNISYFIQLPIIIFMIVGVLFMVKKKNNNQVQHIDV